MGKATRRLNFYIVKGDYESLFGKKWISQFVREIDFVKLFTMEDKINSTPQLTKEQQERLTQLLARYDDMFSDVADKLTELPASLHLNHYI